jgi:sugar (pentulose or hexulose) kinase
MHGAVLLDETGTALAPALLWPDRRAVEQLDRWRALPETDRAALANPLVPGMTGPLLAWLAAHHPQLLARARVVVLPKDALRAGLVPGTDPAVTDRSDASATLLWDVPGNRWSAAAIAAAGVRPELLPAVRPASEVVGSAGLPVGEVPVVVGGADTPLALLAAGTRTGLWAILALYGFFTISAALAYALLTPLFPPEMTGRVNTASNVLMFGFSFLFQWGIGTVLRLYPVVDGRYSPEGYAAALWALVALQCATLAWLLPMRQPRL